MAYVVVYTDKGEKVWASQLISRTLTGLQCRGNTIGSSVASGLRRAAEDAEALEQGRDPERRAMRLADAASKAGASYREEVRETLQSLSDEALAFQSARIVGGINREECDRELARRAKA